MAILVLIPLPGDLHPMRAEPVLLRSFYANMYAEAALESIEDFPGNRTQPTSGQSLTPCAQPELRSPLHPGVPLDLEPILALLVLGVYEYCQHGNRKKMRSHVYQALTMSMDLSLHSISREDSGFHIAQMRAWWMTVRSEIPESYSLLMMIQMFLVHQSAIFTHSVGLHPKCWFPLLTK